MRSSPPPRSLLRAAAWFYLVPLAVVWGLALLVLGFGLLAVAFQLMAAVLKHAGT